MGLILVESRKATKREIEHSRLAQADFEWMIQNYQKIWEKYRGKYVAIVNREIFVGDSREEVKEKVKRRYPGSTPLLRYVPFKKRMRVV
ncbi:hypothetical protein J7J45_00385 [Candidatus Aerophobetes bacterium]|nr:hypothetical protein [Candidatus Aerophobetes bacterium]